MFTTNPLVTFSRRLKPASFVIAATAGLLMISAPAARAQAAEAAKPLDQSFPEKVGTFARSAAKKSTSGTAADATDSAEAKYTAPSGEIIWTATAFATPEKAMEALVSALDKHKADGAKVGSAINNAEGKIRFAVLETKQGPTYCWVNKKQKNVMYVVTGKAPDVSKFVEAQTTW